MRIIFDVLVGLAVIGSLPFLVLTWWYARQEYYDRKPVTDPPGEPDTMAPADTGARWRLPVIAAFGALLLLFNCVLLAVAFGLVGPKGFDPDQKLQQISHRDYVNQTVYLDGYEFVECSFNAVTLVYKGDAPFLFTNSHFAKGAMVLFVSPNPAINLANGLMVRLVQLGDQIQFKIMGKDELENQQISTH